LLIIFFSIYSSDDAPYARRSSGSVLMSPPVEGTVGTVGESEQQGFYLLKKDSQRRATLVQVINDDAHSICELWMHLLQQSVQDLVLTQNHLQRILLPGLRDFIPQHNRAHIQEAIASLKEELDFDGTAINQIQLALLTFQEAVNLVLRNHSIKPHWMFALDSLIRSAVQAAITVLSPELGENIAGGDLRDPDIVPIVDNDQDHESTSGVSTINSNKSVVLRPPLNVVPIDEQMCQLQQKSEQLKSENLRLWQELIETQETLREMIKSTLNETKMQIQLVQQQQHSSPLSSNTSTIDGNHSIDRKSLLNNKDSNQSADKELVKFLTDLECDKETVAKVSQQLKVCF
jgi:mitogen-activated protein kinase kinase kinase 5